MINLNGMTYYENITIIEFYDAPDEDSLTYDFSLFESSQFTCTMSASMTLTALMNFERKSMKKAWTMT